MRIQYNHQRGLQSLSKAVRSVSFSATVENAWTGMRSKGRPLTSNVGFWLNVKIGGLRLKNIYILSLGLKDYRNFFC